MHVSFGELIKTGGGAGSILPAGAPTGCASLKSLLPQTASKQRLRLQLYLSLMLLDLFCVVGSFILANYVRFGTPFETPESGLVAVLSPLFIVLAFNSKAYSMDVLSKPRVGAIRAAFALVAAITIVLLVAFSVKASAEYARSVLFGGLLMSVFSLAAARFFFGRFAWSRLDANPLAEIVIVDGVKLEGVARENVFSARSLGLIPDPRDPLMLDRLGCLLSGADKVVIACAPTERDRWAMLLKGANIQGEIIADELRGTGAIGIGRYSDMLTIAVSCGPLDLRSRAVKRFLDLVITIPVLVFLMPLLVVVAAAIKLESRGPIFFAQRRLGRGNRLFNILKFRSMKTGLCDPDGHQSTLRDDVRITRIGRIIRATSIDELPQLINVLRGEMSLVGPRPHALGSLAGSLLFWEVDPRYWHRHACKPGITGLAQVRGFRGATHESSDLVNRLQADLEYLAGWTIWRDVAILFRTLRVLVHRNAY